MTMMDYLSRRQFHIYLLSFMALIVTACSANIEQDVILTPNLTAIMQKPNKILHFDPKDQIDLDGSYPTQVPWEEALKYTMYLALTQYKDDGNRTRGDTQRKENNNEKQLSEKKSSENGVIDSLNAFKQAPLLGYNKDNGPKFGDIILLGRGRLERGIENDYAFVHSNDTFCEQKDCEDNFSKNVSALWSVHKIRHRQDEKKHRYELRFRIFPIEEENSRRDAKKITKKVKNFILKDNDYPKYFTSTEAAKRNDENITGSIDRTFFEFGPFHRHPINPPPSPPPAPAPFPYSISYKSSKPELNLGEYYTPAYDKPYRTYFSKPSPSYISYPNVLFTSPKTIDIYRPTNAEVYKSVIPEIYKSSPEFYRPSHAEFYKSTSPQIYRPSSSEIYKPSNFEFYKPSNHEIYKTPEIYKYSTPENYKHLNPEVHRTQSHITSSYPHIADFVKFPENTRDTIFEPQDHISDVRTNHLHHHYFLNKNKVPIIKATVQEKQNYLDYRGAVQSLTKRPNLEEPSTQDFAENLNIKFTESTTKLPPQYVNYQTPSYLHDSLPVPPNDFNQPRYNNHDPSQPPYVNSQQSQLVTPPGLQYYSPQSQDHSTTTVRYMSPSLAVPPHLLPQESFTPFDIDTSNQEVTASPGKGASISEIPYYNSKYKYTSSKYENTRFSEPDPLYHSSGYSTTAFPQPELIEREPQVSYYPSQSTPTVEPHRQEIIATTDIKSNSNQDKVKEESISTKSQYEVIHTTGFKLPTSVPEYGSKIVDNKFEYEYKENASTNRPDSVYPDSINAQLPPPVQGSDLTIPYVETSVQTSVSAKQQPPRSSPTRRTTTSIEDHGLTSTTQRSQVRTRSSSVDHSVNTPNDNRSISRGTTRNRTFMRTTEKPILKWMPKRTRTKTSLLTPTSTTSTTTTSSTTESIRTTLEKATALDDISLSSEETKHASINENIVTVSPSPEIEIPEPLTRKSFATSISVQIGERTQSKESEKLSGHDQILKELPVLVESIDTTTSVIEMIKADVKSIETNSTDIKLFEASDLTPTATAVNEIEHQDMKELTKSIVDHAKRVTAEADLKRQRVIHNDSN